MVSWGERKEEKGKMKTWQALKAADEGKKIRRKWWAASMYCFKDESRFCNPALITHYGTLGKESLEDLIWDDIFARLGDLRGKSKEAGK